MISEPIEFQQRKSQKSEKVVTQERVSDVSELDDSKVNIDRLLARQGIKKSLLVQ